MTQVNDQFLLGQCLVLLLLIATPSAAVGQEVSRDQQVETSDRRIDASREWWPTKQPPIDPELRADIKELRSKVEALAGNK